ncbi:MAG: SDR family oxidoreductase [Oscillochloris sp.]|nr:SDR family oxidoreductase [Oscillochloris sp.]
MASPLHERIMLLTGATSGIGRELARGLARQGVRLVLACRNPAKMHDLRASLQAESGNTSIDTFTLDLASLRSIRQFSHEFLARYSQLHVLINNAGVFSIDRHETEDGFELTMGTNVFGPFLLTSALAPLLAATPGARIVNVGSDAYKFAKLDLNDLQLTRRYEGFPAYATSKLAIQLWTQELAARLRPHGVMVNSLHPGHVDTAIWQIWQHPSWYQRLLVKMMTLSIISAEAGAQTPLYLALSDEVAHVTGAYFVKQRQQPIARRADNPPLQRGLWVAGEQLTGARWEL